MRLASDDIEASEAFFKVLADLRQSADYLRDNGAHRPALRERVWRMVKAAEQDSVLRKRLFLLANRAVNTTGPLIEADTCEDGMTVTFDDMGLGRRACPWKNAKRRCCAWRAARSGWRR